MLKFIKRHASPLWRGTEERIRHDDGGGNTPLRPLERISTPYSFDCRRTRFPRQRGRYEAFALETAIEASGISPFGGGRRSGYAGTTGEDVQHRFRTKSPYMKLAKPSNNYHYNKHLQPYASRLRKNMTKAEASLWKYLLRNSNFHGLPFRRQRPILDYIVDFVCFEAMLIIEIDGYTHEFDAQIQKDRTRQSALEKVGFTVLRLTDEFVLKRLPDVDEYLTNWLISNRPELLAKHGSSPLLEGDRRADSP